MTDRVSLSERYARLENRRDELVAQHTGALPTEVHLQTVKVLGDLMSMGAAFSTGAVPAPLRAMMRALHKLEPELARELAHVPAEDIQAFLLDLVRRILTIVDVPLEDVRARAAADATREDKSSAS